MRTSIASLLLLSACDPCDPLTIGYAPLDGDWPTSTPGAVGLDPEQVGELYCDAQRAETLYSTLVVKDGLLVAEQYYGDGAIDQLDSRASVTKSFTSALVGLALQQGCIEGLDQPMLDFFPEHAAQIEDPRKRAITLEQMLQMRAGYPWEETDPALWDALLSGDYLSRMVEFPLIADPGTEHHYSNLTSHWLGVIVARACETDLRSFADEHLLGPIGAEVGDWWTDVDGYHMGAFELQITARHMARFGQLYLDEGAWGAEQVIAADWVRDSLRSYSDRFETSTPRPLRDWGYGYQWWSARAGEHDVDFAWGHGGSFIFLVDALDLVVVTTADPFRATHTAESWRNEKFHQEMVARFIASLPEE